MKPSITERKRDASCIIQVYGGKEEIIRRLNMFTDRNAMSLDDKQFLQDVAKIIESISSHNNA